MEDKENRQESIHGKGFATYNKVKIGNKTLEDATLNLDSLPYGTLKYGDRYLGSKPYIMHAIAENDVEAMRAISNYFYRTSGIYQRVCNYFATMYRYDWYIVPEILDEDTKNEKILTEFSRILNFLDNTHIAKNSADIALNIIKNGAYYGYVVQTDNRAIIQELPIKYCRAIYNIGDTPAVEFNMRFFDDMFPNVSYRQKILKLFPDEFQKGYLLYKSGKLVDDGIPTKPEGRTIYTNGWYLLDTTATVKFSFANSSNADIPLFINSIPAIIDLDTAEGIDRKRQMQQLIKILVQKLPLDKNNDLVFDVDEAADIHANAVQMLRNTIGVDVLTTFADVDDIDLSDSSQTSEDSLDNASDAVYRSLGISENLFDTDGNLSLEKSILNDEASCRSLILQMGVFWDRVTQMCNTKPRKFKFRLYMLETTQNNYKDLADKYKAQVQLGYSKILPQIALGHSQSSIINTAYFENNVLNLSSIMIPPLQSSVMNAETIEALGKSGQKTDTTQQSNTEDAGAGRPELPEDQKSDKTLANEQSKS